jgi:hypothetical protein
MCDCETENLAKCIRESLAHYDEEPNREYYVVEAEPKKEFLLVCIDPDQVELASQMQRWMADRGVRCVICFGKKDSDHIRKTLEEHGTSYMLTIVGKSVTLDEISGWEMKLSTFEEEHDFDTIYSLLQ